MFKRILLLLLFVGLLTTLPSRATDFHSWRTDGIQLLGSSVGQQSSNLAYNQRDSTLDPGNTNFAEFWEGDLQLNGGQTVTPNFGDVPPTGTIQDNREQDPELVWDNTWPILAGKVAPPPRPAFTPGVPQGWSAVTADLSTASSGVTDDLLYAVTFEPSVVDSQDGPGVTRSVTNREQVINCYYPQTANGLPGNSTTGNTPSDRGTVRPLWVRQTSGVPGRRVRQGGLPGLRVRDLQPLAATLANTDPGVGVVVQPPILARVPAAYRSSAGQTISEVHTVMYLVVGTGENGDQARVICVRVDRPRVDLPSVQPTDPNADRLEAGPFPDPANPPAVGESLPPPNDRFFNPNGFDPTNASHGDVMWSYPVTGRNGSGITPVAGVSFANIGTAADSRPLLFVTTADGQIICLNAKSADIQGTAADGDPAIMPLDNPTPRWKFMTALATDGVTTPGFSYGMAPAVVRTPLTNVFDATVGGPSENTIANARAKFNVNEWVTYVADNYGTFYCLEAPGLSVLMGGTLNRFDPLIRWQVNPPGATFRRDLQNNREVFFTPPLGFQGGTPLTNSQGALLSGSSDTGFDDLVIFSTEKGTLYALDALGRFTVGGADDGKPTGATDERWRWPLDPTNAGISDTPLDAGAAPPGAAGVVLLADNFNSETPLGPNYTGFANWNVLNGSVDLIGPGFFDLQPGNGRYVDMDGDTNDAGRLESKTLFTLDPGNYRLDFRLAGSQRGDTNTLTASLGSVFSEAFTLPSAAPFAPVSRTFRVAARTTARLAFDHAGGDKTGLLLDDVTLTQFPPGGTSATIEERPWPRELTTTPHQPELLPLAIDVQNAAQYARYFSRSALAGTLGANTNPDLANPNVNPGDDSIFVPYLYTEPSAPGNPPQPVRGTNYQRFYEFVGSLKPYGFVQVSRPILELKSVTATLGGVTVTVPLRRLTVGTVKANGIPSTLVQDTLPVTGGPTTPNPNFDPAAPTPDDTVYVNSPVWYDDTRNQYFFLPFGTNVTLTYDAPTSATNAAPVTVTETLLYPSCYRQVTVVANASLGFDDPLRNRFEIRRTRASLGEAFQRLEQRQVTVTATGSTIVEEDPALVPVADFNFGRNPALPSWRQGSIMAAGSAGLSGTVMAPSAYRGRIVALSNNLRVLRAITGFTHPDLRLNGVAVGPFIGNAGNLPVIKGDPGPFADNDPTSGPVVPFVEDVPELTDVGASVSLVNGWMYVTYRNGHTRAYSNVGGGASGAGSGNPPLFQPPALNNGGSGTVVWAPEPAPANPLDPLDPGATPAASEGGIHLLAGRRLEDVRTIAGGKITVTGARLSTSSFNPTDLDKTLMVEYGQTLFILVDFGRASRLLAPQSLDFNKATNGMTPAERLQHWQGIDGQVLQGELRGQVIGGPGAVQGLGNSAQGVRPQLISVGDTEDHIGAIVPIFCGLPSGNPLTPGTPMLWERDPNDTNWNFDGQIVYHVQITQQGVQWRWRDRTTDPTPAPNKVHYWDQERPDQGIRFKTTGGLNGTNAKWNWRSEWAPLISYNNPLALQYDPDVPDGGVFQGLPGVPSGTTTLVDTFTDRQDTRRKNGDHYRGSHSVAANGSRAGSGNPEVPVVGMGIAGGQSRQLLYGDHGRTTPVATDLLPGLGNIGVADRSFLGAIGQSLKIRVQRVPLTKMGSGAALGSVGDPALAGSAGSFQQNANYLDDGPHGMYSSISENRLLVTKAGTAVDVSANPIPIKGRDANYQLPVVVGPLNANVMDRLGVQIDVPTFTADDLYSTRWRYARPEGALPTRALNPFAAAQQMWDRAEAFARAPFPAADDTDLRLRNPAHLEERPHPDFAMVQPGSPLATLNPENLQVGPRDDRLRRVAIFVDANGNGQLDLAPNLREAYRTFAVQVMVKPEMKLEAQQQALDLGAVWHGKKQTGLGRGNAAEAWEWQAMQQMLASGNPVQVNLANFYRQYWRPFTLRNTGNVNLAFVKPEVAYQIPGQPVAYIGLPSPGNDPFRALTLISPLGGAALRDPLQIFLRTSFDDMLLPDQTAAYGAGTRGVWLQKSVAGAGQPSAVLYAARNPGDIPADRDPSNGGLPRESYLTLNLPTGTAMGQYRGSLRFFNDRGVTLVETPALAPGYRYVRPETLAGVSGTAGFNGTLDRDPRAISLGEPLEPATDPPVRLVTKVTENVVHGRFARADNDLSATTNADRDRRNNPAVAPNLLQSNPSAPQGTVRELMVAYVSNRPTTTTPGVPRPSLFDLYGTRLVFDTTRGLFPYDEIPQFRDPWRPLTTTSTPFWTQFSDVAQFSAGGQNVTELEKPCIVQDVRTPFRSFVAWTTRRSVSNQGSGTAAVEQSVINYQRLTPTPGPLQQMNPGGQFPDLNVIRSGVRFLPIAVNAPPIGPTPDPWFAFYSTGQGTRRTLAFTTNGDPSLADNQWSPERVLPTSRSLSTVGDPFPIVSEPIARQPGPLVNPFRQSTLVQSENAALPQLTWLAYSGQNERFGQRDVYLSRHRVVNGLLTAGGLMGTNQITPTNDYGRMAFPRVTSDVLKANAARTVYTSGGADFQLNAYSLVTLYLGRGDIPPGAPALVAGRNGRPGGNGSLVLPLSLLPEGTLLQVVATNGEFQLPLEPAVVALGATPQDRAELQRVRVMLDIQGGTFRLSVNTRTLARLLLGNPRGLAAGDMPDPVLSADYTATTLRLTRGDAAATRPVLVASWDPQGGSGSPVMDASWYRQWIDPFTDSSGRNKYQLGLPVAGQADRIWVLWNRATGTVSGGPTLYYKVLRPGIRVRAGSIHGVRPAELLVRVGGAAVVPEEVNPQTGQIFLTRAQEGQPVEVDYLVPRAGGGFTTIEKEAHFVTWQDESGEKPVPLELSVNESGVDAFASYEDVQLTRLNGGVAPVTARHLERVWLFWSSSRGASGDLFYGSLAPRIGPDVNVNGSITLFSTAAPGGRSSNAVRAQIAGMAAEERRHPFTLPGISRRGPYLPVPGSTSPLRGLSSR